MNSRNSSIQFMGVVIAAVLLMLIRKEVHQIMKKTAIISGGSRGIGYAIAKQLGSEGYQIVVISVENQPDFSELDNLGIDWLYVKGSIDSKADRENLLKQTLDKFGRVDVLVNNAGVAPVERKDILEMTEESFDRVVGINTKGTMFMTQMVANQMISQEKIGKKKGTIVNIGSCSAEVVSTARGEYCISKAGVAMITKLFAERLAPEGILVHEVRPGVIATSMTATVEEKYNKLFADGAFPIARWGQPEDVANIVSLFCSDKVLYTTGNYLDVDGGFHIQTL